MTVVILLPALSFSPQVIRNSSNWYDRPLTKRVFTLLESYAKYVQFYIADLQAYIIQECS